MAEDDATRVASRRLPARFRELGQVAGDNGGKLIDGLEQSLPGSLPLIPAHKHRIDDGRSSPVDVDRTAHLGGTRQRRRTG
jgi:hypothetical protein